MSKGYNELVGLQVAFSNTTPEYTMTHYYRWTQDGKTSPTVVMQGYKLTRTETEKSIMDSLRLAYAPVILSIWEKETLSSASAYFQFQVGALPHELSFSGEWSHVADG